MKKMFARWIQRNLLLKLCRQDTKNFLTRFVAINKSRIRCCEVELNCLRRKRITPDNDVICTENHKIVRFYIFSEQALLVTHHRWKKYINLNWNCCQIIIKYVQYCNLNMSVKSSSPVFVRGRQFFEPQEWNMQRMSFSYLFFIDRWWVSVLRH